MDTTTPEGVQEYFEDCKRFWIERHKDPVGIAIERAFWWDCIEVWNNSNGWNPAKEKFAKDFWGYKPGDPIPELNKKFITNENYEGIYDSLCTALTAYEAAEDNTDYDKGFALYKEIVDIVDKMAEKIN